MPPDDPQKRAEEPGILDAARERAAKEAGRAAALTAIAAVETVAHSALDAAERFLFGKVGGATEASERDAGVDPLDRVREAHGVEVSPTRGPAPTKPDPVEEAKKQLAELKKQRAAALDAPTEAPERKKTL
ncbi:hypothetical protein LBMAG42_44240 [Deltaproteobacteria bacterium]|nr:hypothetical protein LBMAG42_44240 [Deltaproteobacteria bacterium]